MLVISKSGVTYPVTKISLGVNLTVTEDSNGLPIIDGAAAGDPSPPPIASSTVSGTVKTDVTDADPVVYLKSSADTLLAAKAGLSLANVFTTAQTIQTGAAGNWALKLMLSGESQPRLGIENGGSIKWSDGTTIDASISRSGAAQLTISGSIVADVATLSKVSTFGVIKTSANVGVLIQAPAQTAGPTGGGLNIIGGGFTASASRGGLWAGSTNDLGTYTARATSAAGINFIDGQIRFYTDTGLTAGNTYTPTQVLTLATTGATLIGATGDLLTIHDNASGGSLIFRSDGTGQTRVTFGSVGYIAGASGKVNISSADNTRYVSLQIGGVEKAWLRTDGIFDFNSGSWEKIRLETGATALVRLGSDSNGMNLTSNAVFNGTAWTRDDTTKPSFAFIQHLGSADIEFRVATANTGNISWITPFTIAAAGDLNITGGIKLYIASNMRVFDGSEDGVTSFNTIRSSTTNLILNAKSGGGLYFNYGHGNIVNFCNGSQGVVATVDNTGKGTFFGLVTTAELSVKDASLGFYKTSVSANVLFSAGISGANGFQIKRNNASADTKMYWLSSGDVAKASVDFESGDSLFHTVNATSAWLRDPNQTTGQDVPLQVGRMSDTNAVFSQVQINDATDDLFAIRVNRWNNRFRLVRGDSTVSEKINFEVYGGDGIQTTLQLFDGPTGSTNPVNVKIATQGQSYITGTGVAVGIGVTANTSGYMLEVAGSVKVNGQLYLAANGQGIKFTDDGDFADLNDGYLSLRFSNGVRIYSGNATGSPMITLASSGTVHVGRTATTETGNPMLMIHGGTGTANTGRTGSLQVDATNRDLNIGSWSRVRLWANVADEAAPTTGTLALTANTDGSVQIQGALTLGTAGSIGGCTINNPGASPVSRRISFGTDGSGWQLRFAKNVSGTVTDLMYIVDDGSVTIPLGTLTLTKQAAQLRLGGATTDGAVAVTGSTLYLVDWAGNNRGIRIDLTTGDMQNVNGDPIPGVHLSASGPSGAAPNGTIWCQV